MNCKTLYYDTYGRSPDAIAFCPYRISPLGAHIDHQYGKINGFAIDKGIHIAYSAKHNGVVELQSLNFPSHLGRFCLTPFANGRSQQEPFPVTFKWGLKMTIYFGKI